MVGFRRAMTRGSDVPRRRVALVNASSLALAASHMQIVASALQSQVEGELAAAWRVSAQVRAVGPREAPRASDWPIWLVDPARALDFGGVHRSAGGAPYALVIVSTSWTVAASHEMIEMLVDPSGTRFAWGPSLDPAANGRPVRYLVEPADPCESSVYDVDGVPVSDFATPSYFGIEPPDRRFDHLGQLKGPYDLPASGNLSWWDPQEGRWYQRLPGGRLVRGRPVRPTLSARLDRDLALDRHGNPDMRRPAAGRRQSVSV
jgi:hypothetical protein